MQVGIAAPSIFDCYKQVGMIQIKFTEYCGESLDLPDKHRMTAFGRHEKQTEGCNFF